MDGRNGDTPTSVDVSRKVMRPRAGHWQTMVIGICGVVLVCMGVIAALMLSSQSAKSANAASHVSVPVRLVPRRDGCGSVAPTAPGSTREMELGVGTLRRAYRLHLPLHYLTTQRYALVLSFHGHTSTAARQESATHFSRLADSAGFIVAYPQGIVGPDGRTGWSSGGAGKPQVDDIGFVNALLTDVEEHACVDHARIYATGFSNGGGMTSVLACALSERIAAFAPVSGSYYMPQDGCHPTRPVPILELHGTGDTVVPYGGIAWKHQLGAIEWLDAWAARDGCAAKPRQAAPQGPVTAFTWVGCRAGTVVEHQRIAGWGHAWPTAPTLDATDLIWHFFTRYTLPTV